MENLRDITPTDITIKTAGLIDVNTDGRVYLAQVKEWKQQCKDRIDLMNSNIAELQAKIDNYNLIIAKIKNI